MKLLENKNILLAVTGSIAVYKSLELVRLYIKAGANVKVIMTEASKKFIQPLAFETVSQNKILDDTNEDWSKDSINNHIAIGKWADIFVIAPCSANSINKLSNGIADNIFTQTALAYPKVKLLAPAANTNMIENPFTKASLKMLKLCNYKIINPISKELACRDVGNGAMAEVVDIFHATVKELLKDDYWSDRKIVVNGGGTVEKIDDVRYISNFSSGKMAASLATALYYRGADVCLITTKKHPLPNEVYTINVQNTQEMFQYCTDAIRIAKKGKMSDATLMDDSKMKLIQKKPYFFSVAAVSDYIPKFPQEGKIKKADIGETWELPLKKNIDILHDLNKEGIYSVGFKAETDKLNAFDNALNMLENKHLDAVCLNIISNDNNFGSDENTIELITDRLSSSKLEKLPKLELSLKLLDTLKEQFYEK